MKRKLDIFFYKLPFYYSLLLTTLVSSSVHASTLYIATQDTITSLQLIKYNNYLTNNKEVYTLNKSGEGFLFSFSNTDTVGIIVLYNNIYSHPYYLTPNSNDSIRIVNQKNRIQIICSSNNFNYPIQEYDNFLFHNIATQKKDLARKLTLVNQMYDSLQNNRCNFVNKSLRYQLAGFTVSQLSKHRAKEKTIIDFSKSLPAENIDSRIGAMMAFFVGSIEKLWYCAQHTQQNIQFLSITNRNQLNSVIFNQTIFSNKEFEDLSHWLRLNMIQRKGYYVGDTRELNGFIDSVYKLQTNPFIKSLFETAFYAVNKSTDRVTLNGYPFLNAQNQTTVLDSFAGKYVLIDFWATWCKPFIAGFDKLSKIKKEYAHTLEVVSINVDDDFSKMASFLNKRKDLDWTFLYTGLNESVLSRFDVTAYPHYALIDKEGNIIIKRLPPVGSEEFKQIIERTCK